MLKFMIADQGRMRWQSRCHDELKMGQYSSNAYINLIKFIHPVSIL